MKLTDLLLTFQNFFLDILLPNPLLCIDLLINVLNKFEDKFDEKNLSVLDEIEQELMNVAKVIAYELESEVKR